MLAGMHNHSSVSARSASDISHLPEAARRAELQRLLPLWPRELDDLSLKGRRNVMHFLSRALREERRRARAGHWTYDLARHAALVRHYKWECEAFEQFQKKGTSPIGDMEEICD